MPFVCVSCADPCSVAVLAVNTTTMSGCYGVGTVFSVSVWFSGPVVVFGPSTLTLALSGLFGRAAAFVSGNGTSRLVYEYTVVNGDFTTDLNYQHPFALSGSIVQSSGMAVNLTLPALDSPLALSGPASIGVVAGALYQATSIVGGLGSSGSAGGWSACGRLMCLPVLPAHD